MKARWKGATLAESNDTIVVENNHYFPPESINDRFFDKTDHHTDVHGKGLPITIQLLLMASTTKMLPGIILIQRKPQPKLLAMWHFGMA